MGSSPFSISLYLFGGLISYWILRAIYRLTYHPLTKFPGPSLAAVTTLYAGSYDLSSETSFCKILPQLHNQYGPIVRIRPNELHIQDIEAYNQVYRVGTPFRKDPVFYNSHIVDGSFFNVHGTREAKSLKDAYQPYFSRSSIQQLESSIHEKVQIFVEAVSGAAQSSRSVDLSLGYRCLTADVVMDYCYQKTFGALHTHDFHFQPLLDLEELFRGAPLGWYFPVLMNAMSHLLGAAPRSFLKLFFKPMVATFDIQKGCKQRLQELQTELVDPMKPTVFQTALHPVSKTMQQKQSLKNLSADALLFFAAGTDTTAHALTVGTWHMARNPDMVGKLRKEFSDSRIDSAGVASWAALEKLPYLRAVVQESLRLSFGVPGRIPRVVPPSGANFCGRYIPAGTIVSQCVYTYHMSEQYFTDATSFVPERWLGSDSAELEKKLLSFSRGSRGCLGINLAYAELFITFANILNKFDMEIWGTTERDMDWKDCYTPVTYGHLKVLFTQLTQGGVV